MKKIVLNLTINNFLVGTIFIRFVVYQTHKRWWRILEQTSPESGTENLLTNETNLINLKLIREIKLTITNICDYDKINCMYKLI